MTVMLERGRIRRRLDGNLRCYPRTMKSAPKTVDPNVGVAPVSAATGMGRPGGKVLTEADVPALLLGGSSFAEVDALQLTSSQRLEEIARELVDSHRLPAERFSFLR